MIRTLSLLATLLVAAPALLPACAQPGKPAASTQRFRGTVESRDGDTLTVRRRGGSTITVTMNPLTQVFAALGARLRDIKPESYLTVVDVPGTGKAQRVTLFSPSERGFAAGRQPWDTEPGATLTGGWVSDLTANGGLQVTLNDKRDRSGDRSTFEIPKGTALTQVAPGEKALLVPGAPVSVFATVAEGGALDAGTVIVGRLGTVPTL